MSDILDEILDECIDRINRGESLEDCLVINPEYAEELKPLLQAMLESQRAYTFVPSPVAKLAARKRFNDTLAELELRRESRQTWLHWLTGWSRAWAAVGVILLALIGYFTLGPLLSSPVGGPEPSLVTLVPTGTIEVRITDAPPSRGNIEEIIVVVDPARGGGIEIHKAGAEENSEDRWIPIEIEGTKEFKLLELKAQGTNALLGSAEVPASKYTQIRMTITEVRIKFDSSKEPELAILPSGKLKFVRHFEVAGDGTTTILLDFIADKSVVETGQGKVMFKPVVKLFISSDVEPVGLETGGTATAEWSKAQSYSGKYSIHLQTLGTPGGHDVGGGVIEADEARIVFPVPEGTTLADVESISWWEYLVQGYPPHVDIVLDINGDGVADDRLVFEYAYNTESHYAEGLMPYGALTEAWYQTFSDDDLGPSIIDNEASGWLASGPAGPPGDPGFIYHTLADWKVGIDITGDVVVDENDIWGSTSVLALEIEVDNWVIQNEAYIDDIVVNYAE